MGVALAGVPAVQQYAPEVAAVVAAGPSLERVAAGVVAPAPQLVVAEVAAAAAVLVAVAVPVGRVAERVAAGVVAPAPPLVVAEVAAAAAVLVAVAVPVGRVAAGVVAPAPLVVAEVAARSVGDPCHFSVERNTGGLVR